MIEFINVTKKSDSATDIFVPLNLFIENGHLAHISGATGVGKSIILNMIMGLSKPSSGRIMVNQIDMLSLKARQMHLYRKLIGYVPGIPNLLVNETVFDNVSLALVDSDFSTIQKHRQVDIALNSSGYSGSQLVRINTLNKLERQQISLARAIVNQPLVLLADSPTTLLDSESSQDMAESLDYINSKGLTMLITGHTPLLGCKFQQKWILKQGVLHEQK